jgi:hypothetical protein
MAGKLPIDRVRENGDGPAIYELEMEQLARQRAAQRREEGPRGPAGESLGDRDAAGAAETVGDEAAQEDAAAGPEQEDGGA